MSGQIRLNCVSVSIISLQIAMVKQTILTMKQPQLGQKIQEWRKAKGMTQEELVERCNINVRTIQRIEAGEVAPRPYKVKAILEVLEVKSEEVKELKLDGEEPAKPDQLRTWLRFSFVTGIIYLIFAIVESVLDMALVTEGRSIETGFGMLYTSVKMGVLVLFIMFTSGFFKLGQAHGNILIKLVSILMIGATGIFIVDDILTYWNGSDIYSGLIFRSIVAGSLYVLFATGFLLMARERSKLYLMTGVIGLMTGVSFLTVVFAIPGLVLLTVFEVFLLVVLHAEYKGQASTESMALVGKAQVL